MVGFALFRSNGWFIFSNFYYRCARYNVRGRRTPWRCMKTQTRIRTFRIWWTNHCEKSILLTLAINTFIGLLIAYCISVLVISYLNIIDYPLLYLELVNSTEYLPTTVRWLFAMLIPSVRGEMNCVCFRDAGSTSVDVFAYIIEYVPNKTDCRQVGIPSSHRPCRSNLIETWTCKMIDR